MKYKSDAYITGPFWVGIETVLLKLSIYYNVKMTITKRTGWISKTYFFTIESDNDKLIELFKNKLKDIIMDFTNDD